MLVFLLLENCSLTGVHVSCYLRTLRLLCLLCGGYHTVVSFILVRCGVVGRLDVRGGVEC